MPNLLPTTSITERSWRLDVNFIVYLVPPAINATFTPIILLSSSATFRTKSSDFGRIILAHLLSSSSVANTDVIGDPCLTSKASRASRMALEVASEHDWIWSVTLTNRHFQIQFPCLCCQLVPGLLRGFRITHLPLGRCLTSAGATCYGILLVIRCSIGERQELADQLAYHPS